MALIVFLSVISMTAGVRVRTVSEEVRIASEGVISETVLFFKKVRGNPNVLDQISINASYSNIWEQIATFPERRPFGFNVALATVKTCVADLTVQLVFQRHRSSTGVDWRRSAAFATFGCLYVGLAQWFFYVSLFSVLCPHAIRFANEPLAAKIHDTIGLHDLARQVFYDNLILEALIYFPVFYVIKEAINAVCSSAPMENPETPAEDPVQARSGATFTVSSILSKGLGTYGQNFFVDNALSCAMWIPGDVLIYSVPMFLRMPFDHALSFAWTMGLSYMRGGEGDAKDFAKVPTSAG